ncbi:MAG: inositol monophosphatase family protein [Sphaerochaetaceae bacterium]
MILEQEKLDKLAEEVHQCGLFAKDMQSKVHRTDKNDGTPVTEADLSISKRIIEIVKTLFPLCNIISEEERTTFDKGCPYTFVLDPVDGTDVYSQGLPSWAVALGILDSTFRPVGAYISAPRFGIAADDLFVRLDPGKKLLVNNVEFHRAPYKDKIEQITMSSTGQKKVDLSHFEGKLRCFGSSILHLLSPVLFDHIQASIEERGYIWDIVASHAVLLNQGMDLYHEDGSAFVYEESLFQRRMYERSIYAGTKACTDILRKQVTHHIS